MMIRAITFIYATILAIWILSGGIHLGMVCLIVVLSLAGTTYIQCVKPALKKHDQTKENLKTISQFYGYGWWGWLLLFMMFMTVASLIPLPGGLLSLVSPKMLEIHKDIAELTGESSALWGMSSAAPGRTAFALLILAGFWGIFTMTSRVAGNRQNMMRIVHIMVASGGILVCMMGLKYIGIHLDIGSTGASSLFHIGLPINPNHTSGILVILSLLSLGAGLTRRHRDSTERRILWFIVYIIFSIALILLKSRGAILGWGAGHLVFLAIFFMAEKQASKKIIVPVMAGLGIVLAVILYISASTVAEIKDEYVQTEIILDTNQIQSTNEDVRTNSFLSKTQMYGDFVDMGKEWGRVGTGRSAFADVYPEYQSFSFHRRFRHAENEYLEILMEYGWFTGTLLLLMGCIGIFLFIKRYTNIKGENGCIYGLLAGVIAVLIQNCFDFNLRYLTVGVPFWISIGILEGRRLRWKYGKSEHSDFVPTKKTKIEYILSTVISAGSIVCILMTIPLWYEGQTENKLRELRDSSVNIYTNNDVYSRQIASNLSVRPASADVRKFVAFHHVRLATLGPENDRQSSLRAARKWYESAQKLAPRDADISIHLAKTCFVLGDESCAAVNYIKTMNNDPRQRTTAMNEMIKLGDDFIQLPDQIPDQKLLISSLIQHERYDLASNLIQKLKKNPGNESNLAELEYQLYKKLEFDEGMDLIAEEVRNLPLTPGLFKIRCEYYIKHKQYNDLFSFMESSETVLKDYPDYWRLRLYHSVYYGQEMGDSWYRESVPALFWQFRQISVQSRNWLFDEVLCEARYALGLKQYKRAQRSAEQALSLRPNHKEALKLLEASKNEGE